MAYDPEQVVRKSLVIGSGFTGILVCRDVCCLRSVPWQESSGKGSMCLTISPRLRLP